MGSPPDYKTLLFPLTDSVRWAHRDELRIPVIDYDTLTSFGAEMTGSRAILHWSMLQHFRLHELAYGPADTPPETWTTVRTNGYYHFADSLEEHVLYAARIRGLRINIVGDSNWRAWTDTICFGYGDYTVNALSNDDSWGTVSGGGTYNIHSTATLRAAPAQGYHFVAWHDGDTLNPRSITVMSDTTLVALFAHDSSIGIATPEGIAGPTLHPNPARGQVTVLSPLPMQQLEAVDLQGRTVLSMPASGTKATFSVAGWPAGIYTVRIVTDSSTCCRRLRVE